MTYFFKPFRKSALPLWKITVIYKRILTSALILGSLFAQAQGQNRAGTSEALNNNMDSLVQAEIRAKKIPGAVVQVMKNGQMICSRAYGYAQLFDSRHQPLPEPEKMDTGTLFDLASLTKVIGTTSSVMLLADQGKISVDDRVGKYVAGFDSGAKATITIRHLLTHSAGLTEWYPLYYFCSHARESYQLINRLPLKYPVGSGRHYSDLGFVVLGEIIEIVSGQSLAEFEQKNIFQPLMMAHTGYNPLRWTSHPPIAATSFGNPYEKRMVHDSTLGFTVKGLDPDSWNGWRTYLLRGEVNDGNAWYANEGISGAAGLFSTAGDVQILANTLLHQGRSASGVFLSPQTLQTFFSPDPFHNGLGWMMDPDNSFMKNAPAGSFGHTGFTGTSLVVVPAYDLTLIILINRQHLGLQANGEYVNVNPLRQRIFEAVMKYFREQQNK